jgi:shikimate kinase
VIGVAGTGKSHIVKKMRRSKLNVVDADDGLAKFVDQSGSRVEYDPDGGAKWWRSHFYVLRLGQLEKLLRKSKTVYLFGDVGGQPGHENGLLDVAHLFDRVYYLEAPMRLIKERLAKRTDNPFGKNPEEIKGMAKHKERLDRIARKRKFEVVDATLPVERIVEILTGRS